MSIKDNSKDENDDDGYLEPRSEKRIAKKAPNVQGPTGIPATDGFPRSTFIIIPIVDLFKYSFGTKEHLWQ
jgi:hypothetical protein